MPCLKRILAFCTAYLCWILPAAASFIGTYTVDPSITPSATSYGNIGSLVSDMASGTRSDGGVPNGAGVTGPVTVYVVAGLFNETISIPFIAGSSSSNTITFIGAGSEFTKLVSSGAAAGDYTLQLNGAGHLRFVGISILNTGLVHGYGVQLLAGAEDNRFLSCVLGADENGVGAYQAPLILGTVYTSFSAAANDLVVEDCEVVGGKLGIVANGSSAAYSTGIVIRNNRFRAQEYAGIQAQHLQAPLIAGNTLDMRSTATGNSAIRASLVTGPVITHNRMTHCGGFGIWLNTVNPSGTATGLVANNMVGGDWVGTATTFGIYLSSCRHVDVLHNSVLMDNPVGSARAFYTSGASSTQLNVVNNIFSLEGATGYAFYTTSTAFFNVIDHNDYWITSGNLAYYGAVFSNLAGWQAMHPSLNAGSVQMDPNFASSGNLHIVCSSLNDFGMPIAIADDLDGTPRSATAPDMGADEYTPISITLDLGADLSQCGPVAIVADSGYRSYTWSLGGSLPSVWVTSSATVHLMVEDTNSCRASDTVMVEVLHLPTAPFSTDSVAICTGTETLSAENDGATYLWSTGDTTQMLNPTLAGLVSVTITSADGCTVADSVEITLHPGAMVDFPSDTAWFCLGDVAALDAGSQPAGSTFLWNTGANTQALLASAPGYYHCNVVTPMGCESKDSVFVAGWIPPVSPLGDDRYECGAIYLLNAANPGCSYVWSTGDLTQEITASGSGTYWVSITSPEGCVEVDTVDITAAPSLPVNLGPDRILCDGASITLNAGFTVYDHIWSTGATTPTLEVSLPGTYIVVVENPANGCTGSDTLFVGMSTLTVELGADRNLCAGTATTLDAGPSPISYIWSTGETSRTITVASAGLYAVTATSTDGCDATDNVLILEVPSPTADFSAPATAPLWSSVLFSESSSGSPSITYSWDFGDGSTSTLPSPSHSFWAIAVYNVCLTVEDGECRHTTCKPISIGAPIGVGEGALSAGVTVYPNPSHGEFAVGLDLATTVDVSMELTDVTGRILLQENWQRVQLTERRVAVPAAAGFYFLRLTTPQGDAFAIPVVVE